MSDLWYDPEEDILGVQVSKKDYWKSVEIAPNVVVDISESGETTGFEILKVSESFGEEEMPRAISATKKRRK